MKHNTMLTIASLARHPHEGGTLQRDRQVHRRLLLRLDTLSARRARGLHLHPLGARTVESATGPAPVVQQPEHRKARRTAEVIGADRVLPATAAPVLFKAKGGLTTR